MAGVRIVCARTSARGGGTYWKNTSGTIAQTSATEDMRDWVMSVFGIGAKMLALGWLVGGALVTVIGNSATLVVPATLMAALNLYVYVRSAEMLGS